VGGGGQLFALPPFGIDPVLVPTTLFGRHPGKGAPGGGAVAPEVFESAVQAALDEVALVHADAAIAGYFAFPEQVSVAARAIDALRAAPDRRPISGRLVVVIDPIMGDADTGLYVRPEVAAALTNVLVPRADWLTPNVWELERLTGLPATTPAEAAAVARRLGRPTLVTSVPAGEGEIAVLCVTADAARLFAHPRYDAVPRGTGDLITAVFTAGLIEGLEPLAAAERATRAAAEAARACVDWGATELPLVALRDRLTHPSAAVRVEDVP
jgi:pyridoxine kinase